MPFLSTSQQPLTQTLLLLRLSRSYLTGYLRLTAVFQEYRHLMASHYMALVSRMPYGCCMNFRLLSGLINGLPGDF